MSKWSRAEISEFVRGKEVYGRDELAGSASLPDWLVGASLGLGAQTTSEAAMEATHPEDRNVLLGAFLEALNNPGVLCTATIRGSDEGDEWSRIQVWWLNLIDHPEVGCIVATTSAKRVNRVPAPPKLAEPGGHQTTKWLVFDVHETGVVRSVDGKVRETLGYEPDEMVGRLLSEFLHDDAVADGVVNWLELTVSTGVTSTSRRLWRIKGGGHIWLEASYLNRGHDSIMAVVWDITDKRQQEQELADVTERLRSLTAQYRSLADEVPAAMFHCDLDGRVLFHNAHWSKLIEDRQGETRLHELVATEDHGVLSRTLHELDADEHAERRTIDVRSRDASILWRVALRPTGDIGAGGITVVGSIEDVTATVRLETEIRQDALTGVLNRFGLDEHLAVVLAAEADRALVVFLDLDGFKPVNDVHGHDAGDQLLVEVARRLNAAVRPGDVVGRYGGDEFVVVCRQVPLGDDAGIVERLVAALGGSIAFEGGEWVASASIGAARPIPGEDLTAVLRRADHAMFEAKRARRRKLGLDAR
jgi:diguanylate cyclase (GGDEF)-like protein/PAS domain S-box-containing protein